MHDLTDKKEKKVICLAGRIQIKFFGCKLYLMSVSIIHGKLLCQPLEPGQLISGC
jgi:hypothetical protein